MDLVEESIPAWPRWFPSGQRKSQLLEYTHSTLSVWSLETGEPFVLILNVWDVLCSYFHNASLTEVYNLL